MLSTMNKNKLTSRNIIMKFQNAEKKKILKPSRVGKKKKVSKQNQDQNGTGLLSGNTGSQKTKEIYFQIRRKINY